jgi:hypothetical protein
MNKNKNPQNPPILDRARELLAAPTPELQGMLTGETVTQLRGLCDTSTAGSPDPAIYTTPDEGMVTIARRQPIEAAEAAHPGQRGALRTALGSLRRLVSRRQQQSPTFDITLSATPFTPERTVSLIGGSAPVAHGRQARMNSKGGLQFSPLTNEELTAALDTTADSLQQGKRLEGEEARAAEQQAPRTEVSGTEAQHFQSITEGAMEALPVDPRQAAAEPSAQRLWVRPTGSQYPITSVDVIRSGSGTGQPAIISTTALFEHNPFAQPGEGYSGGIAVTTATEVGAEGEPHTSFTRRLPGADLRQGKTVPMALDPSQRRMLHDAMQIQLAPVNLTSQRPS